MTKAFLLLLAALLASLALPGTAAAQATRTWVSGVGDDANPCSRTAPCKTFAGAISKTAAGGEINCLDPGGWGAVTITKSITIDCSQFPGGILNAGTNGIIVNAGVNDVVTIRGLEINGAGTGLNGIRFLNGGVLIVENVVIRGNNQSNGFGISFQPAAASRLFLDRVSITNNGTGSTGGGLLVQPTGLGSARVAMSNVTMDANAATGTRIDSTGNTGPGNSIVIESSRFAGALQGITVAAPAGTTTNGIMIDASTVANNSSIGIVANGTGAILRVGNTTITGNGTGIAALGGATISTYGNNRLNGNPTVGAPSDGVFTGPVPPS